MSAPVGDVRFTLDDPRIEPIPETGCWLWLGTLSEQGYGMSRVRTGRFAHRHVWTRLVGPIPEGMVLDHTCRVRSCVNPDHLRVVTRTVNNMENSRGVGAVCAAKTHCSKCGGAYTPRNRRPGWRECKPCGGRPAKKMRKALAMAAK